ncbi:MAG: DUF4115 domain-containing protein [Anaerolineaceae bacterium]|nr:DUF4115 domain-containing protein [Anaerolineaceae bacterium]
MANETQFGEALKSIRLSKQYTVQEVSLQTRIHERFINAFENGQREVLPSKVQAKGYIRNLLAFYQEDAKPFLDAWDTDLSIKLDQENQVETEQQTVPTNIDENSIVSTDDIRNDIEQNYDSLSATEILSAIGKQLAARRFQLGLELTEVEDFTHLKDHNLSFLEKGGFDQIPSPVQARGMLKIYAEFLELDHNALLQQYAEGLRKKRLEQIAIENAPVKKRPTIRLKKNSFLSSVLTPDFLVVGSIVLVLFIAIIWGSSYVINLKQEAAWEKMGVDQDIIAQADTSPSPTLSPTAEIVDVPAQPQNTEEDIQGEEITADKENGLIHLNLTAQQRAWVRITADNQIVFEGRLIPGNPYNYDANQEIVLLTGNAAAIHILYNNQFIGSLGKNGELLEMVFNNQGMITPTPLYSPTPTSTMQPTSTPTITATVATSTVTPFIP